MLNCLGVDQQLKYTVNMKIVDIPKVFYDTDVEEVVCKIRRRGTQHSHFNNSVARPYHLVYNPKTFK